MDEKVELLRLVVLALAAVGIFCVFGGLAWALSWILRDDTAIASAEASSSTPTKTLSPAPPQQSSQLLHAAAAFFAARTAKDFESLIRNPDQTMAHVHEYLTKDGALFNGWKLIGLDKEVTRSGSFVVLKLHGEGLPNEKLIAEEHEGRWLFDWDSFVVHQEGDWLGFVDGSEEESLLVRALIRPLPSTDQTSLRFELLKPGSGDALYGTWTLKEELNEMEEVLMNAPLGPFTLEIAKADPFRPREVEIVSAVTPGWVIKNSLDNR